MKLVIIAGTGTEVGKTWLGCQLALQLGRAGFRVAARKLAQSFHPSELGRTDAELLAEATGERATDVCPAHRWYPRPMAPPMAAESMGLPPVTLAGLLAELSWPGLAHIGLLEQAGGLGSPQAVDADGTDVVKALAPQLVVLVAAPGLGTLSSTRLALRALGSQDAVVYLNRFDPADELHERNRRWLAEREHLEVLSRPGDLGRRVAQALERPAGRPGPSAGSDRPADAE